MSKFQIVNIQKRQPRLTWRQHSDIDIILTPKEDVLARPPADILPIGGCRPAAAPLLKTPPVQITRKGRK